MYDDNDDGSDMERAYDRAHRLRQRMQATEDRDTGMQLDAMPSFEAWAYGATQDDTEDDDAETDGA